MMSATTRAGYTPLRPQAANDSPSAPGYSQNEAGSGAAIFIPVPESPVQSFDIDDSAAGNKCSDQIHGRWAALWAQMVTAFKNNTGILLVAASQLFFSLMNVSVKKLNSLDNPVSTLELVFVRMGITYICCIVYMYVKKVPDPILGPKGVRLLLLFRGFTGFFGLFGCYYSLEYLSLSDATVLTFLAPLFSGVTGALFLKEKFTAREALAGMCSFLGVVLIARPQFLFGTPHPSHVPVAAEATDGIAPGTPGEKGTPERRLVAVGVALIGVVGSTGAYTSMSAIGKRAHALHSLTSFSSQCVIVSTIGMLVTKTPFVIPSRPEWLAMLAMIGIIGFVAQTLLVMGFQRETAGRGSMGVYVQIIFALTLERIFFHVQPSALSIAGMIDILGCAIYVILTKENGSAKKKTQISLDYLGESALEEGLLHDHRESWLAAGNLDMNDSKEVLVADAKVDVDGDQDPEVL